MSLNKSIKSGKEHRKPYRGSKAFDHTCRNHGTCKWCESNRKVRFRRREESSKDQLKDLDDSSKTD